MGVKAEYSREGGGVVATLESHWLVLKKNCAPDTKIKFQSVFAIKDEGNSSM